MSTYFIELKFENFLEEIQMSNTTSTNRTKKRHIIMQHAKKPHGIGLIALFIFVAAWSIWTFLIW
jgi:hypothetical protein